MLVRIQGFQRRLTCLHSLKPKLVLFGDDLIKGVKDRSHSISSRAVDSSQLRVSCRPVRNALRLLLHTSLCSDVGIWLDTPQGSNH